MESGEKQMRVLVVDNVHLLKSKAGDYYSPSIYSHSFLERYLKVFNTIQFMGKVKLLDEDADLSNYNLVSGENIEIIELPWYQGLKGMIKNWKKLFSIYRNSCKSCDCCIFRVAQIESFLVYILGKKKHIPFVVEVVNDPETFVDMPKLMSFLSAKLMKHIVAKANGASYVTEYTLQGKYPNKCKKHAHTDKYFESFYSSVDLEETDIFHEPIVYTSGSCFKIVHVSNAINGDIKGHYTLIKAAQKVVEKGEEIDVICIGDGSSIDEYKKFIHDIGMDDHIHFIGRISDKRKLLETLRNCNMLVLPTKMEGLPRTIIESMAVGLPCISTPVAGIPELLENKYLFDQDDYDSFANEIVRLINNPKELYQMSEVNLKKANQFARPVLEKRRTDFYENLRRVTEKL